MAKFNMVVPHGLTQSRLCDTFGIDNLKIQFGDKVGDLRESWRDDTYLFEGVSQGFTVSGAMIVKPSQIEITANLPWLAVPFKGPIEAVIRERLMNVFS